MAGDSQLDSIQKPTNRKVFSWQNIASNESHLIQRAKSQLESSAHRRNVILPQVATFGY